MNDVMPRADVSLLPVDILTLPQSAPQSAQGTSKPQPAATPIRIPLATLSIDDLAKFFHFAGAALLAVMCGLICTDAVARLLFNAPFAGTSEVVAALLVAVTCLQLPYVLVRRLLLRVTFVLLLVGPGLRNILNGLAYAVGFAFFGVISLTSVEPLLKSIATFEYEGTMSFQIPLWPLRLTTCALWGLAALICLRLVVDAMRGRLTGVEDQVH